MICKILKLSNGDTLVGNVVEETKGFIEVHRPMRVVILSKGEHMYSLSLTKWDPLMNFSIPARIFKQTIVSVSEATTDVIRIYGQAYTEFDDEAEIEDDNEVESENRMADIKEEIDKMREALSSSSNNHILH
jgi:hypothetical protein